jgi:diguanylate cyclase (GGDEF)-like protein
MCSQALYIYFPGRNPSGQFSPVTLSEIIASSSRAFLASVNRATAKVLFVPGCFLLAAAALLAHSGLLTLAAPAMSFLYYAFILGGLLLSWRFHSSRVFYAVLVLILAHWTIASFSAPITVSSPVEIALHAAAVLVPLDFILIAFMQEQGFTVSSMTPIALFLFVQTVIVWVFCRAVQGANVVPHLSRHVATSVVPAYGWIAFWLTACVLLVRFFLTRNPTDSALLWSLAAFFLSLRFAGSERISTTYSIAAALILATSIIENSYLLAYHDELTTLPSRRAYNEALLRLQQTFSIAVVDIDHFKRFNDTYGHDTGDQVLRLVASNLSRVTGGGQAYRCGGEEFAIVFPGKTTAEVVDHLERLRMTIEFSEFRMRNTDRRQTPRGPDRRTQRTRGRGHAGRNIRQLTQASSETALSVTVSIGVASSHYDETDADRVMQAADRALYRAKTNGRNRVESASTPRRRTRIKTAGIA